jgi:hypothetical protein
MPTEFDQDPRTHELAARQGGDMPDHFCHLADSETHRSAWGLRGLAWT